MRREGRGASWLDKAGGSGWGALKGGAERNSDCMSADMGLNQTLFPMGLRWVQAGGGVRASTVRYF